MSEALSADLTNGCIDSTLSAIEVRARNNSGSLNTVNVGPFSAFNVDRPPSTSHDQVELSSNTPETNQAQTAQSSDLFVEGCNQIITTDWDLLLGTGGLLEWDDLFGSDFDAANSQFDFAPNTYVQQDLLGDSWQCQQSTDSLAVNSGVVASTGLSGEQVDVDHVDRSPPTGLPNDTLIFAQAPALLRQFKDRWLSYFSPIPTPAKSPWEVLNLANALGTLADVTFMGTEDVSHARRANLFGLLACTMKIGSGSSESMSNTSSHDIAEMMQYCANRAKFHMQQSLQHETCEPRKSKYKDQLMAILSLGLYAVRHLNSTLAAG
ncbi:Hypothetical protein D9617_1g084100 [Elsinoe fawcettii]|nr:Hypothetical protein D9617_1g084100 [Elsinoe fawcettii]